jgi:hypothetical protein
MKWSADRLQLGGALAEGVDEDGMAPAVGRKRVGVLHGFTAIGGTGRQFGDLSVTEGCEGLDVHQLNFGWR